MIWVLNDFVRGKDPNFFISLGMFFVKLLFLLEREAGNKKHRSDYNEPKILK